MEETLQITAAEEAILKQERLGKFLLREVFHYVEQVYSEGKVKLQEDSNRDLQLIMKLGTAACSFTMEGVLTTIAAQANTGEIAIYCMQEVAEFKHENAKVLHEIPLNMYTEYPKLKAAVVEVFTQLIKQ